jgi:hypothetical protein
VQKREGRAMRACLLTVLLFAGCAGPRASVCSDWSSPLCRSPEVVAYLLKLRSQVYAKWRLDPHAPRGRAQVYFRLSDEGKAFDIVARGRTPAVAESCERALREAGPFDPPPLALVGVTTTINCDYRPS